MKVIISLTSIPSRFEQLGTFVEELQKQLHTEIWVNIPKSYKRFPEWNGLIPNFDKSIIVNSCEDYGPATKVIGPALHTNPGDLIVYLDDDTVYDERLVTNLIKWWTTDQTSAWGLSGFNFENYFNKFYPRQHGAWVDVLEGYGAVIVKARWIQNLVVEFNELRDEASRADDVILSNLLTKQGIGLRTVFTTDCNIGKLRQLEYGFDSDALHHLTPGGHHENYRNVLKSLEAKGKSYFTYKCS
jgi:hypothetical protein